jgi:hypothetical protein
VKAGTIALLHALMLTTAERLVVDGRSVLTVLAPATRV